MKTHINITLAKALLSFFVAVSTCGNAAELTASLSTDVEYSDNIGLDSTGLSEDVVQSLGLNVRLLENRKNFQADANFRLSQEYYYNNSFSDQTSITTGFGLFNFDLIESFLNWRTSFSRTELLTDSAASDTPDNREHRDILRSGPSISYRISRASNLGFTANYMNIENSDEDVSDSKRIDSRLSFVHRLNSVTELTLDGQYGESIDADENDEYANANVNVGFVRYLPNGELQFNYGRTKLIPEHSGSTEGNYYNFRLTQEQLIWHDISVEYQEDISEASVGFEVDEQNSAGDTGVSRTIAVNDTLKRKRLIVDVSREVGNFSYSLSGFMEKETFVIRNSDERSRGVSFRVDRDIFPGFRSGLEYIFQSTHFVDQPLLDRDKDNSYRVDFNYELSAELSVNGFLNFTSRSNGQIGTREYEEISTGFGLNWVLY